MANNYKTMYMRLKEQYQELYEHMEEVDDENRMLTSELYYYADYIKWKRLSVEFTYFRNNAYEKYDEDSPFPSLTL